jgi:hypothetical protein
MTTRQLIERLMNFQHEIHSEENVTTGEKRQLFIIGDLVNKRDALKFKVLHCVKEQTDVSTEFSSTESALNFYNSIVIL